MIDPKAYGRPRSFSGADEEWDGWAFVARSHLSLLTEDAEHWLEVAEAAPGGSASVLLAALTAEARDFARVLYHVLVSTVQGKALAVIRGGERANGLQCWVLLCDEYEPKSGSRLTALLCGLLAPPWQGLEGPAFLRALAAWEVEVRRYESQSQEAIGEGIKVATLMRHAPESVRHLLRHSASSVGTSFARARQVVQDYVKSGVDYTVNLRPDDGAPGVVPMDVNALGSADAKPFEGYCKFCGAWGHRKATCRKFAASRTSSSSTSWGGASGAHGSSHPKGKGTKGNHGKGKGNNKGNMKKGSKHGVGELADPDADAWGNEAWDADDWPEDNYEAPAASDEMHLLCELGEDDPTCDANSGGERINIFVDSGASVNAMPTQLAQGVSARPLAPGSRREYATASGASVVAEGTKQCTLDFQHGQPMKVEFTTMGVRRPIASVAKMVAQGNVVVFAPEHVGGSYVHIPATGDCKNIFARRGVFEMPAWIRPVADQSSVCRVAPTPAMLG